jgi:hypothetical protein
MINFNVLHYRNMLIQLTKFKWCSEIIDNRIFFFFYMFAQEREGRFKLVTSTSWGVVLLFKVPLFEPFISTFMSFTNIYIHETGKNKWKILFMTNVFKSKSFQSWKYFSRNKHHRKVLAQIFKIGQLRRLNEENQSTENGTIHLS